MKLTLGMPAEGDNFFGREKEQKQIWRKLNHSHLLMLAPRRIGKTSLLKRLRDTSKAQKAVTLYCSFAKCKDELACIKELGNSLSENQSYVKSWSESAKNTLSSIKGIKFAGFGVDFSKVDKNDWAEIGQLLTKSLTEMMRKQDKLIICIDELPIFILNLLEQDDGLAKVKLFLNWFRDLRQNYSSNIRWILAGSIGLDSVTRRLNIGDTINDLIPFPLGAFEKPTAIDLLKALGESENLTISDSVANYLITIIGWPVPYYLQVMLDNIVEIKLDENSGPEITNQDVDKAFEYGLTPERRIHFDYWRQRLTEQLGPIDSKIAVSLLSAISKDTHGVEYQNLAQVFSHHTGQIGEQDNLDYLLDVLQGDGYIIKMDNSSKYQFRMAWLKAYWQIWVQK